MTSLSQSKVRGFSNAIQCGIAQCRGPAMDPPPLPQLTQWGQPIEDLAQDRFGILGPPPPFWVQVDGFTWSDGNIQTFYFAEAFYRCQLSPLVTPAVGAVHTLYCSARKFNDGGHEYDIKWKLLDGSDVLIQEFFHAKLGDAVSHLSGIVTAPISDYSDLHMEVELFPYTETDNANRIAIIYWMQLKIEDPIP